MSSPAPRIASVGAHRGARTLNRCLGARSDRDHVRRRARLIAHMHFAVRPRSSTRRLWKHGARRDKDGRFRPWRAALCPEIASAEAQRGRRSRASAPSLRRAVVRARRRPEAWLSVAPPLELRPRRRAWRRRAHARALDLSNLMAGGLQGPAAIARKGGARGARRRTRWRGSAETSAAAPNMPLARHWTSSRRWRRRRHAATARVRRRARSAAAPAAIGKLPGAARGTAARAAATRRARARRRQPSASRTCGGRRASGGGEASRSSERGDVSTWPARRDAGRAPRRRRC